MSGKRDILERIGSSFIHDLLIDTVCENLRAGGRIGKEVRSHFGTYVISFLFEGVEHGNHEHDVLGGNSLRIYAVAYVAKTIGGCRPCGYVILIRNGERFLNKANLSNRSLFLVSINKFSPGDSSISDVLEKLKFRIINVHLEE